MVEIFNYSTSVYEKHSSTNKLVNDFRKEIQMEGAAIRDIAKHAQILDMTPKPSALSTLMQTNKKTCWASFSPPTNFHKQRFSTPYLVPSLGSPDKQDQDMEKISSYLKVLTRGKFSYRSTADTLSRKNKRSSDQKRNGQHFEQEELEVEEEVLVREGTVLLRALDQGIKSSNLLIDYVISRIFQFVQG
ncbi:DUF5399 domain-containing protein [Chlamydia trachomatis]|uniref:Uncharacterized protein CT_273 n=3 Tax=Chlamydia trachomatis TaxID=813 RepID=Y273_CHLTR|nr:DUF5399 domain-containing protein [Chlamydia trachomatis]NP_219778.1 hypothetical protein CT_273 [Chlamydia trachomatis D/UW-3/CX]O84275.1 RecName: Full=Uncharacterized protein CT_273 [Chlamydia trachomatis D/UW-3/CX]AAC67866.1 hypothetical protein CT_273 [Chlamydia trachomatis D/UW-3/CX]AAX50533.1 hypothetical protein CTA_0295 [Chlamydia trachomatis A/HAR-13]ADH17040.1 hypothetical protein E150_01420 [Chlamydia trachomatis E/150]ADH17963.1 hypothetical protein G9768_01400 [Chlamydia trach